MWRWNPWFTADFCGVAGHKSWNLALVCTTSYRRNVRDCLNSFLFKWDEPTATNPGCAPACWAFWAIWWWFNPQFPVNPHECFKSRLITACRSTVHPTAQVNKRGDWRHKFRQWHSLKSLSTFAVLTIRPKNGLISPVQSTFWTIFGSKLGSKHLKTPYFRTRCKKCKTTANL